MLILRFHLVPLLHPLFLITSKTKEDLMDVVCEMGLSFDVYERGKMLQKTCDRLKGWMTAFWIALWENLRV